MGGHQFLDILDLNLARLARPHQITDGQIGGLDRQHATGQGRVGQQAVDRPVVIAAIGGDDMGDMGGMGDADMGMDTEVDELAGLMEYVDKVAAPKHGDNGTNTKSLIDNMKNDMGGTVGNIVRNDVEVHGDAGVKAGGTKGGLLAPTTKPLDHGNVNVPGAKKATTLKPVKGGGIDRQAGFNNPGQQVGATDSSGKGESNTQSTLRARK